MPTETKASASAQKLVGSFAYMLPDTEVCRERVAALIDAALVEAKRHGYKAGLEAAAKVNIEAEWKDFLKSRQTWNATQDKWEACQQIAKRFAAVILDRVRSLAEGEGHE